MPKELKSELKNLLGEARGVLEDLQRLGLGSVQPPDPADEESLCTIDSADPGCRTETLIDIANDLGDCQRCGLCAERKKIVFGVGHAQAELVLVGEGPGREEDEKGEPFVGEAGRLLDRILLAMGLQRSDVYICNVVKCRPPGNRDPQPDEIAACEPFLQRQLAAIRPRAIIALGKFAAQTLLQQDAPISRLRGTWTEYHGIPLMPTFHPAYLLRNPLGKKEVWDDMKQVLKHLRHEQE
ncbi:MAG: DNA polymerase [Desulfuromonas sp.]|nr:MAG: DNA polymerase [Desulfuromonas sp.]